MNYIAITQGVTGARKLVPAQTDPLELVTDNKLDYYKSIYYYNDAQYEQWKRTGSIAGIDDVHTDTLVWDFDAKDDTERARKDAVELCARLLAAGIPETSIQIAFSGLKGFSIEVRTDKTLSVGDFTGITASLATGLNTYDVVVRNASRIIRLPMTRHQVSGLYKFPLTLKKLNELTCPDIKKLASDLNNMESFDYTIASIPQSIYEKRTVAATDRPSKQVLPATAQELNFKDKPKGLTNCKFAMLNGFFPGGRRNDAVTALAATLRALGYPQLVTYYMIKGATQLQADIYDSAVFNKKEVWTSVSSVYAPTWKGAQFSCKNQPWLKEICDSLGPHKCKAEASSSDLVQMSDLAKQFSDFSENIDKNTIKTGLKEVDDNLRLTIGMPVGLLGAPSSGKTSLALDILSNTSKEGIDSVFFSMDMYSPLIYQKQIARITGWGDKEVHRRFKEDRKQFDAIRQELEEEYKNVNFSTKAGLSVQKMRDVINEQQDRTGRKVKLVLIDYLECISGPYSDALANVSKIAGELRDFATEMAVCNIVLLQPPKSAGDASYPLTSMRQIKGASMLEQSFRAILGIYREGFGPNTVGEDKYTTVNALKNTMGELFSIDYAWDGPRQRIHTLDVEGEMALAQLREQKKLAKSESSSDGW